MWTLFLIWLAGAVATYGVLQGILIVEDTGIDTETKFIKALQSWYAFGVLIGIMLAEVGRQKEEREG